MIVNVWLDSLDHTHHCKHMKRGKKKNYHTSGYEKYNNWWDVPFLKDKGTITTTRWIPYGDSYDIRLSSYQKFIMLPKSSNSNASIMKQMIEHIETNDNTFDFAIVQLSTFGRAMVKEEDVIQKLIETNQHHLLPKRNILLVNNMDWIQYYLL